VDEDIALDDLWEWATVGDFGHISLENVTSAEAEIYIFQVRR
jgi:hypothetical protein